MNARNAIALIISAALLYALWEAAGHWFLMFTPMALRHVISGSVGLLLALAITWVAVQSLVKQDKEIRDLIRIKDYLLRMEAHYRRLESGAPRTPQDYILSRALETRFDEDQRNFINSRDLAVRAKAVVDLTDLASTQRPGVPTDIPSEKYPYFIRSACRLAAGLYLERDQTLLAEIAHAVEKLAKFAAEHEKELLGALIEELAHSNRMALSQFISALSAHYLQIGDREKTVDEAVSRMFISEDRETTRAFLYSLAREQSFAEAVEIHRQSSSQSDQRVTTQALELAGVSLSVSRDALVRCLGHLPSPTDLPSDMNSLRVWRRSPPIDLHGSFLVDARLENLDLSGAILRDVHLEGAKLYSTRIDAADLTGGSLERAMAQNASLRCAKIGGADLRGVGLSGARLEGADLRGANVIGALLINARLDGAMLWRAAVKEDDASGLKPADFTGANWWDASFHDPLSSTDDRPLVGWLRGNFPAPREISESEPVRHAPPMAS